MIQTELLIPSSLDGSLQPSLFYQSSSSEKRPLLVGLHTWSYDRFNQIGNMLPYAETLDFHLLLPEFRGPNLTNNPHCTDHILACYSSSREEMLRRSPISYLDEIARANLKLFHGKYDPTVPVSHSIDFFNRMMERHPSARTYLDIFDGGHEIDMDAAMYWLLSQYQKTDRRAVTG